MTLKRIEIDKESLWGGEKNFNSKNFIILL